MDVALSVARGLYEASRLHVIEVCGIADPPEPHQDRYRCRIHENNLNICVPMRDDESPDPETVKKPGSGAGQLALPPGGGSRAKGGAGEGKEGSKHAARKAGLRGGLPCVNKEPLCCDWASKGECTKNEVFMKISCAPACGLCEGGGVDCTRSGPGASPHKGKDTPTLSVSPLVDDSSPVRRRRTFASSTHFPFASTLLLRSVHFG